MNFKRNSLNLTTLTYIASDFSSAVAAVVKRSAMQLFALSFSLARVETSTRTPKRTSVSDVMTPGFFRRHQTPKFPLWRCSIVLSLRHLLGNTNTLCHIYASLLFCCRES